jgi:hypothetical protein
LRAIPTDIYDKSGNLTSIEFHNMEGEFLVVAHWDPNDEQTSANREQFRKWAYRMVEQLLERDNEL